MEPSAVSTVRTGEQPAATVAMIAAEVGVASALATSMTVRRPFAVAGWPICWRQPPWVRMGLAAPAAAVAVPATSEVT